MNGLLIIKNEQDVLQRCIDSFSNQCDQFFILDTGSDSLDYLHNLKCSKPLRWKSISYDSFKFDVARNDCIEYAEHEGGVNDDLYFMMIDADDLACDSLPLLTKDAYALQYVTSPTTSHHTWRIWKSTLRLRYTGVVHEYLNVSGCNSEILDVKVIHAPLQSKQKDPERNYKLLKAEMPTMRQLFYMGNELMDLGKRDEACVYWRHYIDRAKFESTWNQELMCCYFRLARFTINNQEAFNIATEGLNKFPNCGELMGEIAYRSGKQFVKTIPWYDHLFGERWFYL